MTATVSPERAPEQPPTASRSSRRGDRVFALVVRGAALTILVALAAVFLFLGVEGWDGLTGPPSASRRSRRSPATSGPCC